MAKKLKQSQEDDDDERGSTSLPEGWTTGAGYNDDQGDSSDNLRLPSENDGGRGGMSASQLSTSSNPWRDPTPTPPALSETARMNKKAAYDPAVGTRGMDIPGEANVWGDDPSDSDNEGENSPGPAASPVSLAISLCTAELMF